MKINSISCKDHMGRKKSEPKLKWNDPYMKPSRPELKKLSRSKWILLISYTTAKEVLTVVQFFFSARSHQFLLEAIRHKGLEFDIGFCRQSIFYLIKLFVHRYRQYFLPTHRKHSSAKWRARQLLFFRCYLRPITISTWRTWNSAKIL